MTTVSEIKVRRTKASRLSQVDFDNIPFGRVFSDHMLVADYRDGTWQPPEIVPFGTMTLSPCTTALHYGQSIFEGLKAYRNVNGKAVLFRVGDNFARMNRSAERMVMPQIPKEMFLDGLKELIRIDSDWIPSKEGSSLYIRPLMFANDDYIGVKPSDAYRFIIFTCPVGPYYTEPVKLWVTRQFVRAAEGGTGEAKTAGNYAASYYAARQAQQEGYHNVLWLDAKEHRYVEECGTMNIFFVIDGAAVTPALSGTILHGVTRSSAITLLEAMSVRVDERRISIEEIRDAHESGKLSEAFGAGTAATIAPVIRIGSEEGVMELPPDEQRSIGPELLRQLTDIRMGRAPDPYGWVEPVN
ncbi:MAG TPA: branched-chain amino acid aminotransferase [Vicinamibacteria bacterium]|nr:branched-chain amino acid aminotransferase [Vicinamibacteria bacterium]